MTMKTKMTIRCISGREDQFEVELYGGGKSAEFRLIEFVKNPTVLLQTASELVLFPATAIECVTISLPQSGREQPPLQNFRKARRCPPPAQGNRGQ